MNTRKCLLVLGALFSMAVATVHAAEHGALSRKIDADGDGRISREEAAKFPRLAKHFDRIDTNKDGFVTRDEMRAARMKAVAAHFTRIDTDGDGRISREEANAKAPRLAKHFDRMDTNKDGYLSKDELIAAHRHRSK